MGRQFELVADFQVAATKHGRVDGEQHSFVTRLLRAVDEFDRVCALFKEVELENVRIVFARFGYVFERTGTE